MSATLPAQNRQLEYTRTVYIGGVDYEVSVRDASEEDHLYVTVSCWSTVDMRGQPCGGWYKFLFSHSAYCGDGELAHECIRACLKQQRYKMNQWLDSWRSHRQSAAAEKGGKRGYYTRHANTALKAALGYAANWKIAKAIWKELTKL